MWQKYHNSTTCGHEDSTCMLAYKCAVGECLCVVSQWTVDKSKLLLRLAQMRFSVWRYNNGARLMCFALRSIQVTRHCFPLHSSQFQARLSWRALRLGFPQLTWPRRRKLMLTISIRLNSVIPTIQWEHWEKIKDWICLT